MGGDESHWGGLGGDVLMLRKLHRDVLDELDMDLRILGAADLEEG